MLGRLFVSLHGRLNKNQVHQYWLKNMQSAADISNNAHLAYGRVLYNSAKLMELVGDYRSELEGALIRRLCLEEERQAEALMNEADELLKSRYEIAKFCGVSRWKIIMAIL